MPVPDKVQETGTVTLTWSMIVSLSAKTEEDFLKAGKAFEEIKEYKESLAEYVCNEEELKALNGSDNQADGFYKLWTQKEAVFKMLGSGITKDIKNVLNKGFFVDSYKIGDMWISVSSMAK